ncbi:hypothetical protein YC2023_101891 [Brassica napus]
MAALGHKKIRTQHKSACGCFGGSVYISIYQGMKSGDDDSNLCIERGILLRADQTGVSLDTAASGDSKYKKQDDKLWDAVPLLKSYGRRAPSGGQRVEEGGRENEKKGGEVTENLLDIDPLGNMVRNDIQV